VLNAVPSPSNGANLEQCLGATAGDDVAQIRVDVPKLISALDEKVITPVLTTLERMAEVPFITRLYTKLSPQEMTLDPVFGENPDIEPLMNTHLAQGTSDCSFSLATINLPNDVRVMAQPNGPWPVDADESPAALKVLQYGTTGAPVVVLDQTAMVAGKMFGVAQCAGGLPGAGTGGRGGSGAAGRGGTGANAIGAGAGDSSAGNAAGPWPDGDGTSETDENGGCSALPSVRGADATSHWLLALLLAAGTLGFRRNARHRRP
jgi:hypothetical protein